MTRATPSDLAAALRLLAAATAETSGVEKRAAVVRVYEKLAERLDPLIGGAGVRALFTRSVKLTRAEFPCFADIDVTADPRDERTQPVQLLVACFSKLEPEAVPVAAAALYGTLIGLLTSFIGERLVRRVLEGAFPETDHGIVKETER